MIATNIFLLGLQMISVQMFKSEKSIAQVKWKGKCYRNPLMLNDCNWCRCNKKQEYTCDARVCSEVDMFGHFNDNIRETDPGMDGHGAWRTRETACEPNVQYRRAELLCVCNDDGSWPNPVCRDIFRILYSVHVTDFSEAAGQTCEENHRYLIGCNVCFCSKNSVLEPDLCTKRNCDEEDPVPKAKEESDNNNIDTVEEIYAECNPYKQYMIGCKHCICLRNNRLFCGNCTQSDEVVEKNNSLKSFCDEVEPGQVFSKDCNYCHCDKNGYALCTTKKCLSSRVNHFNRQSINKLKESEDAFAEDACIPGHTYKHDCNTCFCAVYNNHKTFGCTLKQCQRSSPTDWMYTDCVNGTSYELNCLICYCEEVEGTRTQICQINPQCQGKEALEAARNENLDSLNGYCEPLHTYKKDCNTCKCLSDGKTVRCTSHICKKELEPISIDIIPMYQNAAACPKGLSYTIDCNYCFCLSNGNAICTTVDCKSKKSLN